MTLFEPDDVTAPSALRRAGAAPRPDRVVRMALTVAYDGSPFRGFAEQAAVPTVGGALREALERVVGHPVVLTVAGRTDAGVHAWGQVVSFDADADRADPDRLRSAVNRMLGPAVVVREARPVPAAFDARFSATSRAYRYTILNRDVPDPFLAATAWHVPTLLDVRAMVLGCDPLIGQHDFTSFCRVPRPRAGDPPPSMTRRVLDARWDDLGDGVLRLSIEATAFCHQMVRSIVGTLVDVGRYRLHAGDVMGIVRARDRRAAGQPAPPHGLCLWAVRYPPDALVATAPSPVS
jgi:tRNA pseudouridine38-40 synthase